MEGNKHRCSSTGAPSGSNRWTHNLLVYGMMYYTTEPQLPGQVCPCIFKWWTLIFRYNESAACMQPAHELPLHFLFRICVVLGHRQGWGVRDAGSCLLCSVNMTKLVCPGRKKKAFTWLSASLTHASLDSRTPSIQKPWLVLEEISISFHSMWAMTVLLISVVINISSFAGNGFNHLRSSKQVFLTT